MCVHVCMYACVCTCLCLQSVHTPGYSNVYTLIFMLTCKLSLGVVFYIRVLYSVNSSIITVTCTIVEEPGRVWTMVEGMGLWWRVWYYGGGYGTMVEGMGGYGTMVEDAGTMMESMKVEKGEWECFHLL